MHSTLPLCNTSHAAAVNNHLPVFAALLLLFLGPFFLNAAPGGVAARR